VAAARAAQSSGRPAPQPSPRRLRYGFAGKGSVSESRRSRCVCLAPLAAPAAQGRGVRAQPVVTEWISQSSYHTRERPQPSPKPHRTIGKLRCGAWTSPKSWADRPDTRSINPPSPSARTRLRAPASRGRLRPRARRGPFRSPSSPAASCMPAARAPRIGRGRPPRSPGR